MRRSSKYGSCLTFGIDHPEVGVARPDHRVGGRRIAELPGLQRGLFHVAVLVVVGAIQEELGPRLEPGLLHHVGQIRLAGILGMKLLEVVAREARDGIEPAAPGDEIHGDTEVELNGVVIDRRNGNPPVLRPKLRGYVLIEDDVVPPEGEVGGGERRSVRPAQPFAQPQFPDRRGVVDGRVALRHVGIRVGREAVLVQDDGRLVAQRRRQTDVVGGIEEGAAIESGPVDAQDHQGLDGKPVFDRRQVACGNRGIQRRGLAEGGEARAGVGRIRRRRGPHLVQCHLAGVQTRLGRQPSVHEQRDHGNHTKPEPLHGTLLKGIRCRPAPCHFPRGAASRPGPTSPRDRTTGPAGR